MSLEDIKKKEDVREKVISEILEVILKVRIYREWQRAAAAASAQFSEREVLILEIIKKIGQVTEQNLVRIFGLSASSVNEVIKKLTKEGLIKKVEKESIDRREKPIELSEKGTRVVEEIKQINITRYQYALSKVPTEELEKLTRLLEMIDETVSGRVTVDVFDGRRR